MLDEARSRSAVHLSTRGSLQEEHHVCSIHRRCLETRVATCPSGASTDQLGSHTYVLPIPANHQLTITPELKIDASTTMRPQGHIVNNPVTSDQFVDLSDTVRFTSSQVLDAKMQPIAGATISAASGFDYLHPVVPQVPEPETWQLSASALGFFMAWARRRRRPSGKCG